MAKCYFLSAIENADYVVTNSFRGICFSIIFEKEFYIDFLEKNTSATNSRLEGMLKQFNLSKRCIDDIEDFDSLSKIDYVNVNEHKKLRKEEPLEYLRNALERSNLYIDKDSCCGCGACVNICLCDAVLMQSDEYGFAYPVVDEEKCVK